jgi:hypothetical protein
MFAEWAPGDVQVNPVDVSLPLRRATRAVFHRVEFSCVPISHRDVAAGPLTLGTCCMPSRWRMPAGAHAPRITGFFPLHGLRPPLQYRRGSQRLVPTGWYRGATTSNWLEPWRGQYQLVGTVKRLLNGGALLPRLRHRRSQSGAPPLQHWLPTQRKAGSGHGLETGTRHPADSRDLRDGTEACLNGLQGIRQQRGVEAMKVGVGDPMQ